MKIKSDDLFKNFKQGEYFRVCNVSRLYGICDDGETIKMGHVPETEALAIEEKLINGHYMVVAFIRWDDHESYPKYEDVGFRTIDLLTRSQEVLLEFWNCVNFAKEKMFELHEISVE